MADGESASLPSGGAFLVSAVGQIEKAHFPDFDDMYCKYAFVHGSDWELVTVSTRFCARFGRGAEFLFKNISPVS